MEIRVGFLRREPSVSPLDWDFHPGIPRLIFSPTGSNHNNFHTAGNIDPRTPIWQVPAIASPRSSEGRCKFGPREIQCFLSCLDSPKIVCYSTEANINDINVSLRCDVRAKPHLVDLFWIVSDNGTVVKAGQVTDDFWAITRVCACVERRLDVQLLFTMCGNSKRNIFEK